MKLRWLGRAALGLALSTGVAETLAATEISLQEVILRAKPATVLVISEVGAEVTLDCGAGDVRVTPSPFRETGTGWFVDSNGWVVTNAHVVQPAHASPRWVTNELARKAVVAACVTDRLAKQGIAPGARPDLEDQLQREMVAGVFPTARVELRPSISILMSNGFRLPAKVVKYSPPVSTQSGAMSGRDLALLQVEASEMPSFALAESKNAKIGDPIHILGFPGVVLTHELLNSTAKLEASVTNGAVSGFKQDVQNQPVIQTDAPAAWGNSGGPAANSKGDVVGVLTFVSLAPDAGGSIVQGFNFVIPSDAVKEFLKGTPVNLADKSLFNEKWFTGLRKFFQDDWKGAAAAIADANRLQPEFPDVLRLLAEAQDKNKNPPPRPFPWVMATATLAILGVGAVGVMYAIRWNASRHRVSPADVVRLFESGAPPIILDVRAPFAYTTSPFRIPGALYLSPDDLESGTGSASIEPARTVVAYCTSQDEHESARVAQRLKRLGYQDVRVLKGGLGGWTNAGLPLESKPTNR